MDELTELRAQHQRNHGPCGCLKSDTCVSAKYLAIIERQAGELGQAQELLQDYASLEIYVFVGRRGDDLRCRYCGEHELGGHLSGCLTERTETFLSTLEATR